MLFSLLTNNKAEMFRHFFPFELYGRYNGLLTIESNKARKMANTQIKIAYEKLVCTAQI